MSYHLNVRGLAGLHIGKQVTVKTKHTEASGILQGFKHESEAISDSGFSGESWALGKSRTTITLLPYQNIVAEMMDAVEVHNEDGMPQGPRTVEVLHQLPDIEIISRDYIIYGQAITGWPIIKAIIAEAPRNDYDHEWLDTYLPAHVTPYGEIIHAYKGGEDGQGD